MTFRLPHTLIAAALLLAACSAEPRQAQENQSETTKPEPPATTAMNTTSPGNDGGGWRIEVPKDATRAELLQQYIEPVVVDRFNPDVTDANRTTTTPQRGGVLRLRTPADYSDLNPLTSTGQPERMVQNLLYDSLVSQDPETLEFFPKMAWTFAKADLLQMKDGEVLEGTFLEMGSEDNPASEVVFAPGAWRRTFNKYDVASADEGTLTLKEQWGGATYNGEVTELVLTYEINESKDPARKADLIRTTIGELATWKDVEDDGRERPFRKEECAFEFSIRPDIRWQDGEPFTADDVKFSYDTMMNVNVNAQHIRNYFQHIEWCSVLGDGTTVAFRNDKPYFNQFAFVAGIYLIPRHIFNPGQYGGDDVAFAAAFNEHPYRERPIGVGPYKLKEWRKNEFLTVVRNDDYWAGKLPDGAVPKWHSAQPYMDEVRFTVIQEKAAVLKELQKNNIDADLDVEPDTWYLDETNTDAFKNRFVRAQHYGFLFTYVGFNMDRALFSDPVARRAVSMLIPRDRIANDIHQGLAVPVSGPFYSKGPGYDQSIKPVEYDLEGAKRLLRRNGWLDRDGDGVIEKEIDGVTVPFAFGYSIHNARDYHQKIADIIKESVEQAGIGMTIRKSDWTIFSETIRNKDFDAVRFAWGASLDPDPYQIWHSSQADNKGDNFVGYRNKRVDEICIAIRETFDPIKRWDLAREMHAIVAEEQPYAFLFGFNETYFYNRGIRGVKLYPSQYPVDWTEWWWADEARRNESAK